MKKVLLIMTLTGSMAFLLGNNSFAKKQNQDRKVASHFGYIMGAGAINCGMALKQLKLTETCDRNSPDELKKSDCQLAHWEKAKMHEYLLGFAASVKINRSLTDDQYAELVEVKLHPKNLLKYCGERENRNSYVIDFAQITVKSME